MRIVGSLASSSAVQIDAHATVVAGGISYHLEALVRYFFAQALAGS